MFSVSVIFVLYSRYLGTLIKVNVSFFILVLITILSLISHTPQLIYPHIYTCICELHNEHQLKRLQQSSRGLQRGLRKTCIKYDNEPDKCLEGAAEIRFDNKATEVSREVVAGNGSRARIHRSGPCPDLSGGLQAVD